MSYESTSASRTAPPVAGSWCTARTARGPRGTPRGGRVQPGIIYTSLVCFLSGLCGFCMLTRERDGLRALGQNGFCGPAVTPSGHILQGLGSKELRPSDTPRLAFGSWQAWQREQRFSGSIRRYFQSISMYLWKVLLCSASCGISF